MTLAGYTEPTVGELDAIAWEFLRSEFAGQLYCNWPIDRRINAYLLRHGPVALVNDGNACDAVVDRVMANIGHALRSGLLARQAHRTNDEPEDTVTSRRPTTRRHDDSPTRSATSPRHIDSAEPST